jgi:poly(A) polymerase
MNDHRSDTEKNMPLSRHVKPVIIPESDHPIRLHSLDKEALKVLFRLRDAGFAGYLVGGGVRDLYMGKQPKDFDISTDARPGQLRKLFRNSRTIGRRFRLVQIYFRGGKVIEVSTLRSQSEYDLEGSDKVLPSNNTFGTLPEDAFRRDLTINSLFYEIEYNTIIDYVGGVQDLDQGIIRIVGDPDRRITRDPVRMMRAVRHAARTGFSIEPLTRKAIIANREKLSLCPPSRIRDELLKDLRSGSSEAWARLALECGLFLTLFPCYDELLAADPESPAGELLMGLQRVVDRLCSVPLDESSRIDIPDYMHLALLILPWMDARFDILRKRLKGPALYHFSREVRAALDEVFGERLNLTRMAKESMTILLVNLPVFAQYARRRNTPAWVRKKSYYRDCLRFFHLYAEAAGGSPAREDLFSVKKPVVDEGFFRFSDNGGRTGIGPKSRRGVRPALTKKKRGIFGLRGR